MSCERTESLELVAFWVDRSAPEWADLRDHYPRCVDCSEAVAALSEFVTELETRATASAHPDPERLLDFAIAQSSLPADARARIESHVAHCSSCRDELHVVRHFDYAGLPQPTRAEAPDLEERASGFWAWLTALQANQPALGFVATSALAVVLGITLSQLLPERGERGRPALARDRIAQSAPAVPPRAARLQAPIQTTTPTRTPTPTPTPRQTPIPTTPTPAADPLATQLAEARPVEKPAEAPATERVVAEIAVEKLATTNASIPSTRVEPAPFTPATEPPSQPLLLAANLPTYAPTYEMNPTLLGDVFGDARLHTVLRSRSVQLPSVRALAPPHVGATAFASPTLYWYLSAASPVPIEIAVMDDVGIEPLLEIHIDPPIAAGIHALDLAARGVSLEPAISYRWLVALVPDPMRRENDQVASAGIRLAPPDAATAQKLATGPDSELAHRQAGLGYWYDAFATLEGWRRAEPQALRLPEFEAALLEQVDLLDVAGALR
jgi:hypothetical protein